MSSTTTHAPVRRLFGAVSAVLLAVAGLLAAGLPSPAQAATGSYIRLAHLSPDTPNVDVYLTSFSRPGWNVILRGVGYGAVSPYQRITPGQYTVSMRGAGAAASSPAVISTNVQVKPGTARTVAGVGKYASLGLTVLEDDLTMPPAGQARVRIIQASARVPSLDVRAMDGPTIATGAAFASTTPYTAVPAGSWQLELGPSGGDLTTKSDVDLAAGGVYSVIVLDGANNALKVLNQVDSRAAQIVPAGAVDTGLGGTRPGSDSSPWASLALGLGAGLTLVALGAGLARRRRGARRLAAQR